MADNTIITKDSPRCQPVNGAAAGAMTPGHLAEFNADGNLAAHSDPSGPAMPLFADLPMDPNKDKTDDYEADEVVRAFYAVTGVEVEAIIGADEVVANGEYLVSNGDGTLAAYVAQADLAAGEEVNTNHIVAQATEAIDATGADTRGNVRVL